MDRYHRIRHFLVVAAVLALGGCVEFGPGGPEAKIGIGPFKAGSIELGPGGAEAKGPSAGPVKAESAEVGPGGAETKGVSAGPFEAGKEEAKSTEDSTR